MRISKKLQERINRVTKEKIDIVPYNSKWPLQFQKEAIFLKKEFTSIINKIEHFGSTSVPNLVAKPIIDMLIEVTSYDDAKKVIVPKLTSLGYEYFWRPIFDKPPMYIWFIKRNSKGERTHHLHMVEKTSELWDRIYFRDYLRKNPHVVQKYGKIKTDLALKYSRDRVKYTKKKTKFITTITRKAKRLYCK